MFVGYVLQSLFLYDAASFSGIFEGYRHKAVCIELLRLTCRKRLFDSDLSPVGSNTGLGVLWFGYSPGSPSCLA